MGIGSGALTLQASGIFKIFYAFTPRFKQGISTLCVWRFVYGKLY